MADEKKSLFPAVRLILLAAVAGALAGAVAVYVTSRPAGNNRAEAPAAAVSDADVAACAAKADKAKSVAAAATGEVAAMLPADPPQSLKALAFNAPDGKPMTLADRAGKTVLLNLWATWCFPCREEMPALNALQKETGQRQIRGGGGQCRHRRRHQAEEIPGRDRRRGARLLPRQHACAVQRAEDARPGARPAGHAARRRRRLPARPYERPGRLGERRRQTADRGC